MEFLHIEILYMLFIPLILLIILIMTNSDNFEQHFSKEILDRLRVGGNSVGKSARNSMLFLALILFIVALSRPVMDKKEHDVKQKLIPIVIALDLSKSMNATDIYPNRISLAKKKLKAIIKQAKNATIGVVLFAKDSYILSPVTEDFISLNYIVDNLDTDIDVANGSNIGAVLEATSHMLSEYKVKNLIILSDGGNEKEYINELEFAKDNHIAIYSVGLATKQGSPIPHKDGYMTDSEGKIVTVRLNDSIKNLSLQSGGGYIDFSLNETDIKAIVERINMQSKKEELKSAKYKTYTELFYYPLGFGIFILLLATSSFPRRANGSALFLLFSFYLLPENSYAMEFEFENIKKAKEYYEKGEFNKAADEYRKVSTSPQNYYNLANTLYKQGKYKEAINAYGKIVTKDRELEYKKLHNLGNSYVRSNDLLKAKEFYEKALHIKNDKYTKENLDMVNKELEKQKQNQEKNQDQKNDQDNKQNKDQQNKDNQDNKNKDSSNSDQDKNDDKKDQQKNKDKDNKKDDKKNKGEQNKSDKDKENKDKNKTGSSSKQNMKKEPISDMEEKKWMKMLNNKKTPVYLQKVESKKGNSNENQPW